MKMRTLAATPALPLRRREPSRDDRDAGIDDEDAGVPEAY